MGHESDDRGNRTAPLGRAGQYELLLDLASGGMATVYLARALDRDLIVALKRPHKHLASDKMFLTMLLDEARVASAIDHPGVVRVRELAFESGEPFIVLDYVEGCALSDLRKELAAADRALGVKVAVRIVLDALAGLHAAHELKDKETGKPLGIIHRDISPHNLLVGSDGCARLTDFGIAKAEDRLQVTRTHEVKGKLAYLAPERVDKRRMCTRQSDVFSMGVVLWECLAGRRLFRGEEAVDTLEEVMHAPIPRLRQLGAHVPPALDDVLARALSRDLAIRYKTAEEFGIAIDRAAGRGNIATAGEVAEVVEVVFGGRLRLRHQQLRGVLGPELASRVIRGSGLRERPPDATEPLVPSPHLLASIAPAAPTQRYAFGGLRDVPLRRERRWLIPLLVGTGSGVIIGSVGIGVLASRRQAAPIMATSATASAGPPAPTLASFRDKPPLQSSVDAGEIELDPSATASVATSEPAPTFRPRPAGPAPWVHRPAPIGTMHDGFTKLR
ncbi:MAG TPA: serine/threonine-protein kinase [Polyangiaceae bacterium]